MLDVKVARADATHRDAHDGILGRLQRRFRFLYQAKVAMVDISQCFHYHAIYWVYYRELQALPPSTGYPLLIEIQDKVQS